MQPLPPLPIATALEKRNYVDGLLGRDLAARMLGDAPAAPDATAADASAPTARAAMDQILLSPEARKLLGELMSADLFVGKSDGPEPFDWQVTGDPQLMSGYKTIIHMGGGTTEDGHVYSGIMVDATTQHANEKGQATLTQENLSITRDDTGHFSVHLCKYDRTFFGGKEFDHMAWDEIAMGPDGRVSVREHDSGGTTTQTGFLTQHITGDCVDIRLADGPDGTTMSATQDHWTLDGGRGGYRIADEARAVKSTPLPGGGVSITTGSEVALRVLDDAKGAARADVATWRTQRINGTTPGADATVATDTASVKVALAKVSMTA